MSADPLKQRDDYWATYFAVRIACTLREVKSKQIKQGLREDLNEYLRTSVPKERTRDLIRTELRR